MTVPTEVFDRAIQSLLAHDAGTYASLFAPEGVLEWPFASEGRPRRLEGRDAIRAHVAGNLARSQAAGRRLVAIHDVVSHGVGPRELAVEFSVEVQAPEGTARLPYVHFLQLTTDGGIAMLRDYYGPATATAFRAAGSTPDSPTAVFHRVHERVRAYDDGFLDEFFAEDGVLELPFAPAPMPKRIVGREAVRALLAPRYRALRATGQHIAGYRNVRVHETTNPEVIVAEFEALAVPRGAGQAPRAEPLPFAIVYRISRGRILLQRDYFDSLAMAERQRIG